MNHVIFPSTGGISKTPNADDEEARKNGSNPHNSPAAEHGITVMKARGFDTRDHRSTVLTKSDVAGAFLIYCVSKSHKENILKYSTTDPSKVFTLGEDIPDPFGGSLEDYEKTACTMEKVVPEVMKKDFYKILVECSAPPPNAPPPPRVDVLKYCMKCDWIRPKETARQEEKGLYNATMVTANTAYCHHFAEDGRHIVLHRLSSTCARKCKGVLYLKLGWKGKKIQCGKPRGENVVKAGHDPCTNKVCPYIRDFGTCPYMPEEKEEEEKKEEEKKEEGSNDE